MTWGMTLVAVLILALFASRWGYRKAAARMRNLDGLYDEGD